MRYRITIAQQEKSGDWKRIHEVVTELPVHEKAARMVERAIHAEGLSIDGRELREILKEEFGEA